MSAVSKFKKFIVGWADSPLAIIALIAITGLSVGSGVTTFEGMREYSLVSVALLLTIGVQSLMFVFALWYSALQSIRDSRAFIILFGYLSAAAVSVFFSFASFYALIDTPADRRQSNNLELRRQWTETYAKIGSAVERGIFDDAAEVTRSPNYIPFSDNFRTAVNRISVAAAEIEGAVGPDIEALNEAEAERKNRRERLNASMNALSLRLADERSRRTRLNERLQQIGDQIVNLESQQERVIPVTPNSELFEQDQNLKNLQAALDASEARISDLTAQLNAKQAQADAEGNAGGTVREDGSVSPAGRGPLFARYTDEARVLSARLTTAIAERDSINASIDARQRTLNERSRAQAESRSGEYTLLKQQLQSERDQVRLEIGIVDDGIERLAKQQNETGRSLTLASNEAANQSGNSAQIQGIRLALTRALNKTAQADKISLPTSITTLPQAISLASDISSAQNICSELKELGTILSRNARRRSISLSDDIASGVRCTAVPIIGSAGHTLQTRAENLQQFNVDCSADNMDAPPTLDQVLDSKYLDKFTRSKLLDYLAVDSGNAIEASPIQPSAQNLAEARDFKKRQEFIEDTRYQVDYAQIRDKVQSCLGIIKIQDDQSVIEAQKEITDLLSAYNPEAHSFTRTVSAFERNDRKAIIALIIAISIDLLIILFGLAKRIPSYKPTPIEPLEFSSGEPPSVGGRVSGGGTPGTPPPPPPPIDKLTNDGAALIRRLCGSDRDFVWLLVQSAYHHPLYLADYVIPINTKGMEPYYVLAERLVRTGVVARLDPHHLLVVSDVFQEILEICQQEGLLDVS